MKFATFFVATLLAAAPQLHAQDKTYPDRAVVIAVPFTAGSSSDSNARFFAEQLSKTFNSAFVVENRPGASGVVAVMATKNAPADGHSILLASNSPISVNPVTIKGLSYDPIKDFKPVSGLMRGMQAIITSPNSNVRTFEEFVAMARQKGANVGTYSDGYRLGLAWLAGQTGADLASVSYKGAAMVFTDVMGGHIDAGLVDLGGALPLIKAGKLRILAVTGESRNIELPMVPTVKESGYPEYVNYSWTSFYVRSETPEDITRKLEVALQKSLHSEAAREMAKKMGTELMPYTADQMREYQNAEVVRFRRIAEAAGIKPQ
ncbi:MAG: tripartite tricarboxylate transporter substrate binding protein [Rhodoferax sp.]|nr:tripartite tricarboxylate transporter substrate binding protein [Rhodoferax sp.]